jgi:intein/homing endonuclease
MKSTHIAEVIRIKEINPHPNADKLCIVSVYGYTVCVRISDFKVGDLAIYIPPDNIVSDRPEFAFLEDHKRIKVRKLRGIISMGLLIQVPADLADLKEGEDAAEKLQISHYEPPLPVSTGGEAEKPPEGYFPHYDVDSYYRYVNLFKPGERVCASEKVHGCVQSNTSVSMADGTRKKIRHIERGDIVLGVDDHGKVVPSRVIKKFCNGRTNGWLRVTGNRQAAGRGSSFFSVICTTEHKFWNPAEKQYVKAGVLKPGDSVTLIRSELGLTPIQQQVLLGKMLGDGSYHVKTNTATIYFSHRVKDLEYFDWTVQSLGDLDSGARDFRTSGFGTRMIRGHTHASAWVTEKFKSFFEFSKKKTIPKWVETELAPISIAFWYMDDGSLGHGKDNSEDKANFAVCAFSEKDCQILICGLQKFGIDAVYYKSDGYSRLRLNSDNAEKLFLLVAPYIPPCMQRKLPERYRGGPGWMPKKEQKYKPILVEQKITKIRKAKPNGYVMRYDLETETHNYFASGVLTHNSSSRFVWGPDNRLHVGSRTEWKREDEKNIWWRAAKNSPWLVEFCKAHPDICVYGEVYGIQDLKYGHAGGRVSLAVFDLLRGDEWIPHTEARRIGVDLKWVPIVYEGPFDEAVLKKMADGKSLIPGADNIREGIVVKPLVERTDPEIGRVQLKMVSNEYLERA